MFSQEFIFPNIKVTTQDDMFDFLFTTLKNKDYVHPAYLEKIKEREQNFPTGLQLSQIGIAIPHADAEYTKNNTFVVMTSENGIPFKNMEDASPVLVKVIIAIVFSDKDKHMENLQLLSDILQNEPLLIEVSKCKNADDIYALLQNN